MPKNTTQVATRATAAGDQDLFKYVLEYHRDRKVILTPVVSKQAVLRELKRFGLDVSADVRPGGGS